MNKNTFNWVLRGWIGMASLVAMGSGWVAFSHSPKPGAAATPTTNTAPNPTVITTTITTTSQDQLAPIPTLAPLPTLGSDTTSVQQLPQQQAQTFFQPRLRTRGS
jgi:hypothetical protein